MKQFTTPEQTAKLIELGFERPRCLHNCELAYNVGELIEMLPREYDGELLEMSAVALSHTKWIVRYPYGIIIYKAELIDALYDMIVKLKDEGDI